MFNPTVLLIYSIVVVDILESLGQITDLMNLQEGDMVWSNFISCAISEEVDFTGHDCTLPVCILHTGGTTSIPKGVTLTGSNFHSLVNQWKHLGLYYKRNATLLNLMHPFVAFGLTVNLHVSLSLGMKIIIIPEYNPAKTVDLIKQYRPDCIPAAPAHWEAVYNDPSIRDIDLSFIKVAFNGGDTLNIKIEKGLNEIFSISNKSLRIQKAYGMTETTTAVTMTSFEVANLETSVGIPLPQTTIGVFDEHLRELPYNQVGEICVQSQNVMVGYYNNDKATAETLITHKDGSVWLHTGDMGEITQDGILYIKGRIKRIIIRHDGIKVYPVDVETKISEHPAVNNCAVVGKKDPDHIQGDVPVAFIVLEERKSAADFQEQIKDYCAHHIIDYAVPHKIFYVDALPLTQNGKVDYRTLEKAVASTEAEEK